LSGCFMLLFSSLGVIGKNSWNPSFGLITNSILLQLYDIMEEKGSIMEEKLRIAHLLSTVESAVKYYSIVPG